MTSKPRIKKAIDSLWGAVAVAFLATLLALPVQAAVEIPSVPLQSGSAVPPNIMFILDDSGSMHWEIMPDEVLFSYYLFPRPASVYGAGDYENMVLAFDDNYSQNVFRRSPAGNATFYDPAVEYLPWSTDSGGTYPDASPAAAPYNPYLPAVGSLNLTIENTQNARWRDNAGFNWGNRSFYPLTFYMYKGTGSQGTRTDYFRYQYRGGAMYRRDLNDGTETVVTGLNWGSTSRTVAQEVQNFANWFTYYRSRILAARAGIGRAFAGLPVPTSASPAPRVGFSAINKGSTSVDGVNTRTVIRGVRPFSGSDRVGFFDSLYGHVMPPANTPLRRALDDVGNYFRRTDSQGPWGIVPGTEDSAPQLSCRQNYSILMTDGYWNSDAASGAATGDNDSTPGPTITGPAGATFTFNAVSPFRDGRSNTLADVAMHHWKNDLRSDLQNNVPSTGVNPAFWQHMVTFGVGLGVVGSINPAIAFAAIGSGALVNWPDPTASNPAKIDDLLHSAVNSRGDFFSASNPVEFAESLRKILTSISERVSSASNVSANSAKIDTNTQVFQASYLASQWTGELLAFPVTTAGVGASPVWRASEGFPADPSSRKIFTYSGLPASPGSTFPTSIQNGVLGVSGDGHNIADYLRGIRSGERQNGGDLRNRNHVLGDIINSSPVYVKGAAATDRNMLYAGANDGMLHAFDAADGKELFAYVPGGVSMAALKTLSDPFYSHQYFVDGPVVVSDRSQTNGTNLLVGSLGRGGKGVYALDVTDPAAFAASKVLWDRTGSTDSDMGLVINRPIIAKLNNGKTGVIVANGVKSDNEKAVLFIYVLNADGSIDSTIKLDTKYGSAGSPNGLSTPRGWDIDGNGALDYIYAGDLQGNLWKFDLSANNSSQWKLSFTTGSTTNPLFVAKDAADKRQPITGGITIGIDPSTFKQWVFFGTGKYLEAGDPGNKDVQSLYGLIDANATIGARSSNLVERFTVVAGSIAGKPVRGFEPSSTSMPISKKGWFLDLKTPPTPGTVEGERIVGDPAVVASVLLVSSIIPGGDPCQAGGRGYINALNAFTGASVGANFFDVDGDGQYDDDTLDNGGVEVPVGSVDTGVGMNTDGNLIDKLVVVGGSSGTAGSVGVNNPAATGRVSWREIIRD